MFRDGAGGALPMDRQVGRAQLMPPGGPTETISAGDYEPDLAPVRRRWPVVDFASGPSRDDDVTVGGIGTHEGDLLELDVPAARAATEPSARTVDFARARGHAADDSVAGFEGRLLDLDPQPDVVLPSHPTMVTMRRDPARPRVRRTPVVRGNEGHGDILCDIEQALAAYEGELGRAAVG